MIDSLLDGLALVVQWPAIGYLCFGVTIGIVFGMVPGLSGLTALAIMLPFTFTMDPATAFAFLLGMFAVTTTSDCISSILLGIPGTVASQATVLDGHPMAVQGQAGRALGAAFTCSIVGGLIGAFFLALSIPIVRPLILAFASPEFLLLGVLGLTMVGVLSGNSIAKGLVAALIGLMLSLVGYATIEGTPRYTFGTTYLLDGIPLVPLVLGFFALPELLDLTRNLSISRVPKDRDRHGIREGVLDNLRHWWVVLRSSLIGLYIGLLPGLGGAIADWVAYGHVVQSSKDKSRFGKGDVRGVLAPESANNSMKGSALIPVIGFGIPGSAPMAVLMGAFLIQGLTPGPQMLTTHLDITFSLVWTLVLANIIAGLFLLSIGNRIADLSYIPGHLIFPAVVIFVLMGSWVDNNNIADWFCLIAFGILGYLMRLGGFPRPPLILGFILGPIMENAYFLTIQSYPGWEWLLRPLCIVLIIMIIATLLGSILGLVRQPKGAPQPSTAEVGGDNRPTAILLTFLALVLSVIGVIATQGWPKGAATFPLAIGIPAVALSLLALLVEVRATARALPPGGGSWHRRIASLLPAAEELRPARNFLLILLLILGATLLLGQKLALPLFVFLYLRFWGKYRWTIVLAYTLLSWLFLEVVFERLAQVFWYPSLLLG